MSDKKQPKIPNNILKLSNHIELKAPPRFGSPAKLDGLLFIRIAEYRSSKGNSYATLAAELNKFVTEKFETFYSDEATRNQLDLNSKEEFEVTIEKYISLQCPSDKYLRDYANGRAVCFRYINTLANYFGIDYSMRNYDPALELLVERTVLNN